MAPCFAGPVGNSAYSDWLSQPGLDYLLIGLASGAVLAAGLAALAAESRLLAGAMPAAIVLTIAAAAGAGRQRTSAPAAWRGCRWPTGDPAGTG